MVEGIGRNIAGTLIKLIISVAILFFILGILAIWGLPKLWDIIKPFIHQYTS